MPPKRRRNVTDTAGNSAEPVYYGKACARCFERKIKCDRRKPCSSCDRIGSECAPIGDGQRQKPVARSHVDGLHRQLADLESFIRKLVISDDISRNKLLAEQDLVTINAADGTDDTTTDGELSSFKHSDASTSVISNEIVAESIDQYAADRRRCQESRRNAAQFFGGTSLFEMQVSNRVHRPADRLMVSSAPATTTTSVSKRQESSKDFPFDVYDTTCLNLMASVFQHSYEYNHVVYREYFLRDYDARGGPYYSDALMYSICALGAMSHQEEKMRALSPIFRRRAELLVWQSLDVPDLTILQSLVLLGQMEIGQGRWSSKGWLFCGMAYRLTHEMGLHLDPSHWNGRVGTSIDREILRRVYWAVFCVDKQLSLYFGRPPALYPQGTTVRNTSRIPYPPEWQTLLETYLCPGVAASAWEDGLGLVSSFVQRVELAKIFHTMIVEVFENRQGQIDGREEEAAQRVHSALEKWASALPPKLQWHPWSAGKSAHYVLHLHMLFHTGMIILHRPARHRLDDPNIASSDDMEICYESMGAIVRLIRSYSKYYRLPLLPIDFVHTLQAAAQVVVLKQHLKQSPWSDTAITDPLDTILSAMEAVEDVWPCVREIKDSIIEHARPEPLVSAYDTAEFEFAELFGYGDNLLSEQWSIMPDSTSPFDGPWPGDGIYDVEMAGPLKYDIQQEWGIE